MAVTMEEASCLHRNMDVSDSVPLMDVLRACGARRMNVFKNLDKCTYAFNVVQVCKLVHGHHGARAPCPPLCLCAGVTTADCVSTPERHSTGRRHIIPYVPLVTKDNLNVVVVTFVLPCFVCYLRVLGCGLREHHLRYLSLLLLLSRARSLSLSLDLLLLLSLSLSLDLLLLLSFSLSLDRLRLLADRITAASSCTNSYAGPPPLAFEGTGGCFKEVEGGTLGADAAVTGIRFEPEAPRVPAHSGMTAYA